MSVISAKPLLASRRAFMALAFASVLAAPACAQMDREGQAQPRLRTEPLTIDTAFGALPLTVEIADDDAKREAGLMFREAPPKGEGMLFDFEQPRAGVAFWMKNTKVPLDIIFIAPDGKIIRIARMAKPFSEEPIPAGGRVRGVLEIAGGRADQLRIREGDRVKHRIFP